MPQTTADVILFPGGGDQVGSGRGARKISSMELDDAFRAFQQAVMAEIRVMRPSAAYEAGAPIPSNWQAPPRGGIVGEALLQG